MLSQLYPQFPLDDLVDTLSGFPELISERAFLRCRTVAIKYNNVWWNHATTITVEEGIAPSPEPTAMFRDVALTEALLQMSGRITVDSFLSFATDWRRQLHALPRFDFQQPAYVDREASDRRQDSYPRWACRLHELVPSATNSNLPRGTFLASERKLFAPDLPSLTAKWLGEQFWTSRSNVAYEYRVLIEDRRARIVGLAARRGKLVVDVETRTAQPLFCGARATNVAGTERMFVEPIQDSKASLNLDFPVQELSVWVMLQDGEALDTYYESPHRASWGRENAVYHNTDSEVPMPESATETSVFIEEVEEITSSVTPRVFISYSHDSPAHKQWVAEFATFLRHNGIDAVLDQWEIGPGDDITLFMEQGLRDSDRVIVVCTDNYVRKANAGEGGVGYERMIVTAEIVRDLGTNKFIPLIRDSAGPDRVPTFLGPRFFIDLSSSRVDRDAQMETLLRELLNSPKETRPPLGKSPFTDERGDSTAKAETDLRPITAGQGLTPEETYDLAIELARRQDMIGWRQTAKRFSQPLAQALAAWRSRYEGTPPKTIEELYRAVDDAVEAISPIVALALAGVETEMPKIRDQRGLVDDLLRIAGWNHAGLVILADLPNALGFVGHSLLGAMSALTAQFDLVFAMADMEIVRWGESTPRRLALDREVVGSPESLGGNWVHAWKFISSAAERWSWLPHIFGDSQRFRTGLSAYYLTLSCDEFAATAADPAKRAVFEKAQQVTLDVPLTFASEEQAVLERATEIVRRNLPALQARWLSWGLDDTTTRRLWKPWMQISHAWLQAVYPMMGRRLPYANLF